MSVALHGVYEGLQTPSIVTREIIADNPYLRDSLIEYGFGLVTKIEAPQDVLVATLDNGGELRAAGMLIKSPHLMMDQRTTRPEIHVHSGVKIGTLTDDFDHTEVMWEVDKLAEEAANLTLHALYKIAHGRDEWSIKQPVIGVPPSDAMDRRFADGDVQIWAIQRPIAIR